MQKNNINILFICPYPLGESPSQRFRFEQYFELMRVKGLSFSVQSFLSLQTWKILYLPGNHWKKVIGIVGGFGRRLKIIPTIARYNYIFIHREATPIGPPWFEWTVAKLFKKKIIYDFDDAIWLPNTSKENSLVSILKWHSKVASICKWSHAISCGNKYLCNYAQQFNSKVILNPTTIDTSLLHNPDRFIKPQNKKIILGWTGTHSTLKYLSFIEDVFIDLYRKYPNRVTLLVIANDKPSLKIPFDFKYWSKNTEIEDLLLFDIGLMPLEDDLWSRGKCGFKALQYMALKIPTVASAVGVNSDIINHGKNGFICSSKEDWLASIQKLIDDQVEYTAISKAGRDTVIKYYSVASNGTNFSSLFL